MRVSKIPDALCFDSFVYRLQGRAPRALLSLVLAGSVFEILWNPFGAGYATSAVPFIIVDEKTPVVGAPSRAFCARAPGPKPPLRHCAIRANPALFTKNEQRKAAQCLSMHRWATMRP